MADDVYNYQFNADRGVDSTGAPLPDSFSSYASTTTYTYSGTLYNTITEVVVVPSVGTFTRITDYTDDGTKYTSKVVGRWIKT